MNRIVVLLIAGILIASCVSPGSDDRATVFGDHMKDGSLGSEMAVVPVGRSGKVDLNAVEDLCDEAGADLALSEGNNQLAFSKLENCEETSIASGEMLLGLAFLYIQYGSFESEELLAIKFYRLLTLASMKGNYDALVSLASDYETGEPLASIQPDEAKADCLLFIADNPVHDPKKAVQKCLAN